MAYMNIMVFDVAAESGGALSVLTDYYNEYCRDIENNYYIVLSRPVFEQKPNVRIINISWIKKSWFHRLFFDIYIARKMVNDFEIDRVISLQNIIIPFLNIHQTVLVHNALPFSESKIRFSESPNIWIYQNVIGLFIKQSCKNADSIIVQTEWMRKKCIDQLKIEDEKILIKPPVVCLNIHEKYQNTNRNKVFFFPGGDGVYKNHKVVVDSCLQLKSKGINNYKVIFTLKGTESRRIQNLYRITKKKLFANIFYRKYLPERSI